MCGICAISRPEGKSSIPDARKFMRQGAVAIESRGRHATGFAWTDPKTAVPWYWKTKGKASDVAKYADLSVGMRTAIGHTRHATKGDPEVNENNHPIIGDGMALVHNGRVENDEELFSLMPDYSRWGEVDSEALVAVLSDLNHWGVEHPTEVLEMIRGVASIAWLDQDTPHTLHLARLSTRPMTIAETRRGDLVMSSTPETLKDWATRSQVGLFNIKVLPEGIYLRVEAGQVVEQTRFRVRGPSVAVPDDRPGAKKKVGEKAKSKRSRGKVDWSKPKHLRKPMPNQNVRRSPVYDMSDEEIREALEETYRDVPYMEGDPITYDPEFEQMLRDVDEIEEGMMVDQLTYSEAISYQEWLEKNRSKS